MMKYPEAFGKLKGPKHLFQNTDNGPNQNVGSHYYGTKTSYLPISAMGRLKPNTIDADAESFIPIVLYFSLQ